MTKTIAELAHLIPERGILVEINPLKQISIPTGSVVTKTILTQDLNLISLNRIRTKRMKLMALILEESIIRWSKLKKKSSISIFIRPKYL